MRLNVCIGDEKLRAMREHTPATTQHDDGASQYLGDDDDDEAKTNVSKSSRCARSGRSDSLASSIARSNLSQAARAGGGGESSIERVGSLEAVQEESRINTAVSASTRQEMSMAAGVLSLSDFENSLSAGHDEDGIDWDDVMEELLPVMQEALESPESEIRRNALVALRKSVRIGEISAMPYIRSALQDDDWLCRETALHVLRELAIPGDIDATELVCKMIEDPRREVRDAAVKALETVGCCGDLELMSKLITVKEYSKKWAEKTQRPGWEIRETGYYLYVCVCACVCVCVCV